MTQTVDAPKGSFRLSMLLYDTRYRSMTIQITALIGFMILIGWLINTPAQNLAALGKEPSFAFLWETMPRLRWLARLVRLPGMRWLAGVVYDHLLAPPLYVMHKWRLRRGKARHIA